MQSKLGSTFSIDILKNCTRTLPGPHRQKQTFPIRVLSSNKSVKKGTLPKLSPSEHKVYNHMREKMNQLVSLLLASCMRNCCSTPFNSGYFTGIHRLLSYLSSLESSASKNHSMLNHSLTYIVLISLTFSAAKQTRLGAASIQNTA